jgi:hypothetical protein
MNQFGGEKYINQCGRKMCLRGRRLHHCENHTGLYRLWMMKMTLEPKKTGPPAGL